MNGQIEEINSGYNIIILLKKKKNSPQSKRAAPCPAQTKLSKENTG